MIAPMIMALYITIGIGWAVMFTVGFWRLCLSLKKFTIRRAYTAAIEAPSVSICIPARNETHAMTRCLERVLASDYRKLEVIVFDDSSNDDTSILIRSFAHAGVRFVPGQALPAGWLGKNHALQTLALEASGTYVVFMDVDTDIEPTTISQLVGYMTTEQLVMASVIPGRRDTWRASVIFGHLRYFWQLILSRRTAPATSSSLWMIKRHVLLETLGGFVPHKAAVEPESRIAAIIGTKAYHCLVGSAELGVSYEKKWQSQLETSRRLLYPLMGGTWYGALFGLLLLVLLTAPQVIALSGLVFGWSQLHTVAVGALLAFSGTYAVYTMAIWRQNWWLSVFVWPIVVAQELLLALSSVYGYATKTITWKGRSVASPKVAQRVS